MCAWRRLEVTWVRQRTCMFARDVAEFAAQERLQRFGLGGGNQPLDELQVDGSRVMLGHLQPP